MAGGGLGRSFSFAQHDEDALRPSERMYQDSQPYRDTESPSRELQISPPPNYISPPRRDDMVNPPSPPPHRSHPAAHPSSTFNQLQAGRTYGAEPVNGGIGGSGFSGGGTGHAEPISPTYDQHGFGNYGYPQQVQHPGLPFATSPSKSLPSPITYPLNPQLPLPTNSSSVSRKPAPPPHTSSPTALPEQPAPDSRYWEQELGYSRSSRTASSSTPGQDNLGISAAGGGIAGIAMGVASNNERDSGVQALRVLENSSHARPLGQGALEIDFGPRERAFNSMDSASSLGNIGRPRGAQGLHQHSHSSSTMPLAAAAMAPGLSTPIVHRSTNSIEMGSRPSPERPITEGNGQYYADNPYNRSPTTWDPRVTRTGMGGIDPDDIADDGDDGFAPQDSGRRSMLSLGDHGSGRGVARGAAGGAAAGGILGALGGLVGRKGAASGGSRDASGSYGPVSGAGHSYSRSGDGIEKSEWLHRQTTGNKKMRWIVGTIIAILIIAAIAGGVVGGVLAARNNNSSNQGESAAEDDGKGDLTKDSSEIKALMNNTNLHKVFPGIDYTPFNAQYPACLTNPPSQNNVTRDMAVLSQLTNRVRTYGTDCNQTEMVLHAMDALSLTDMKIWLGVWLENNATTNNRQTDHMYEVLKTNGSDPFAGIIVGNEVLFRKDMTAAQLGDVLSGVRSNLTSMKIDLPLATSDLGTDWTTDLVEEVDIVMSNIHPFFGGVAAADAAAWTYDFWESNDVILSKGMTGKQQLISETGWPSAGGNNCEPSNCTSSTEGSVAGVSEMNTFMDAFEAFDEPWKVIFNTPGEGWEDKWGLMDSGRNLKPGIKIPSCDGKTVS
ncbi:MAG: hypothetical protein M1827_004770 [Pycnora praestabilis]|nr:MAG: hypothetical protein M1827_004770 [Pycnora praestabilis]